MAAPVLQELSTLARLVPAAVIEARQRRFLPTGWPALDRLLAGGLPRGGLVEAVGSTGRTALALSLASGVTRSGSWAAYIDPGRVLGAREADAAGCRLHRLLVVRPPGVKASLAAAEEALRSGIFALVVIDLVGAVRTSLHDGVWRRLAHAAEKGEALALLLGRTRRAGTFAQVGLELRARRARFWEPAGGAGPTGGQAGSQTGGKATLLDGLEVEAGVVRGRHGTLTGQVQLVLRAGGGSRVA